MDYFNYKNNQLYAEQVPVSEITKQYGTPCYIYSRATFERHWHAFDKAFSDFPHTICYAVKANPNIAILNLLQKLGSGFDIVSGGELERVIKAGGAPEKTIFSGVGKRRDEIEYALSLGIHCFNVESLAELNLLDKITQAQKKAAPISLRINPDVDAKTHPHISTGLKENKFGIDFSNALAAYQQAKDCPFLNVVGIDCHIGSQITELAPFLAALKRVLTLIKTLSAHNITLHHLNLGGGLGVRYQNEEPPHPTDYAAAIVPLLREHVPDLSLIIEPGRAIAANAGILATQVLYLKHMQHKNFAIVDAAMNDLMRPALYNAWQEIIPVSLQQTDNPSSKKTYDVVGPVCESTDFLGKNRELSINHGDLLAIRSSGAYSFSMSSSYNSRPRVAEILVDGKRAHLIRRRETVAELYAHENLLP